MPPSTAYVPALHAEGALTPTPHDEPEGHASQSEAAVSGPFLPVGQSVQLSLLVVYLPALHASQRWVTVLA